MKVNDIHKICSIINTFGVGEGHPYADAANFKYFKGDYVLECIKHAKEEVVHLEEIVFDNFDNFS